MLYALEEMRNFYKDHTKQDKTNTTTVLFTGYFSLHSIRKALGTLAHKIYKNLVIQNA